MSHPEHDIPVDDEPLTAADVAAIERGRNDPVRLTSAEVLQILAEERRDGPNPERS